MSTATNYEKRRFATALYEALNNNADLFADAAFTSDVTSQANLITRFDYTSDNPHAEVLERRRRSKIAVQAAMADGMDLLSDSEISSATTLDNLLDALRVINPDIVDQQLSGCYLND